MNAQTPLSGDSETIKGKLDNGLTYYIRHNSNPEGCADFYIVHNVGALQEEDNQNGLAHFLEHMAFNGTRHYPQKGILEFLSKEGVRFGYNVNAYTSKTETVYNLSDIPLVRESFVDSVLMILHDWSCDISCEQQELDNERGVISEEWRRRDDSRTRMAMKQNALIYKGAKHTQRSVIGTLEVINGFKRNEIIDFYHKWYRPDLQAIVVVGDFDPEKMEKKIQKMFSDIPAQENPTAKDIYTIPELAEPLFENMIDPQIKYQTLKVIHKTPFPSEEHRSTEEFIKDRFMRMIVNNVVAEKFDRAADKDESAVKSAIVVTNTASDDFYTTLFTISPKKEYDMIPLLQFYEREMRRALENGFSEEEFENARFKTYKSLRLNNEVFDEDVTNEQVVKAYVDNFLRNMPYTYPSDLKRLEKKLFSEITYKETVPYLRKMFCDSEKIYSYSIIEDKADLLPSPDEMKQIISETGKEILEKEEITFAEIDLSSDPQGGKLLKSSEVKGKNIEKWTLSNGITVYWTPCEHVQSDVHFAMNIISDKGYAAFPQDKIGKSKAATTFITRNLGMKGMKRNDILNSPVSLGTSLSAEIHPGYACMTATSDAKNIEKCMSMTYLALTSPYFSDQRALEQFKKANISSLKKKKSDKDLFEKESSKMRYSNHPWTSSVEISDVESLDMDFVFDIFAREFSDFRNMTVYISSDIDKEQVKYLVTKYLGSLKGEYAYKKVKPEKLLPAYKGDISLEKDYPVKSAPKSEVSFCFKYKLPANEKDIVATEIFDHIMASRYMRQIREERGGTYHVGFGSESYLSNGFNESFITFQTRPQMKEILVGDCIDEMKKAAEYGFTEEEMDVARKYLVKHEKELRKRYENSLSKRNQETQLYISYGYDREFDYEKMVNSIPESKVRAIAAKACKGDKLVTVYNEK